MAGGAPASEHAAGPPLRLNPGEVDVGSMSELMWVAAWLLVAAIVGMLGIILAARAVRQICQRLGEVAPFGLQTLRELWTSGQITEAEYKAIRDAMVDKVRKLSGSAPPGPPARPESETPPRDGEGAENGR